MESLTRTPARIRPLSPQLANQIAAGEVVERPASVLKELLENSLDAGASRIEVEVEQGGVGLIRVRDNGNGMPAEDLPLAISRHATSKIHDNEDLLRIASLGFRGEALASIGSVARLRLISATAEMTHAWALGCEAGELSGPVPAAHPPGTSVEVRDLFFNTPARRKFLRTDKTEFSHIDDVVRRVALSRFDVALSLTHNGRQVHRLAAVSDNASRTRRVARLFGQGFLDRAVCLDEAAAGMRLWGWLARPDFSRSQADLQYFYVNGRMIRDRVISHAVRQAYQDALYPGRHPAYVLHLEIEPQRVDVNVHPTKHEVRFREARMVHDFLYRSLRHALAQDAAPAAPDASQPVSESRVATGVGAGGDDSAVPPSAVAETLAAYQALHGLPARDAGVPAGTVAYPPAQTGVTAADAVTNVVVARVDRFIVVNREDGTPAVVDLDAVRISETAARLHDIWHGDAAAVSRPLLVPRTATAEAAVVDALAAQQARLDALGLLLTRAGEQAVMLRAVPGLLAEADTAALLAEVLALGEAAPGDEAAWLACLARHGADSPAARLASSELTRLLTLAWELAPQGRDTADRLLWQPLTADVLAAWFNGAARTDA